jgi:hypothetical protein
MKKIFKHRIGRIQVFLSALVWVLLLTIPILVGNDINGVNWEHIFKIWKEYSLVFGIFLVNRFILVPKLLLKTKHGLYTLSIACLIGILTAILFFAEGQRKVEPPMSMRPPMHAEMHRLPPPELMNLPKEQVPPFANIFIISILLIGFDTGLIFSIKWMESEQNRFKIEKESMENKLAFLQNQISPHFFMNTLNNIHALVDINTDEAKESIIKLSHMMGYMLYESQTEKISLSKEIDFIKSYVELMKLRFTNDVEIILDVPETMPQVNLPPLLTISFIENAFKYGISYQSKSFIHIAFHISESRLNFRITNSINASKVKNPNSGIGIQNSRNRLDLIYDKNYNLAITESDDKIFTVDLNIPL